jgi:hypothetical protein
MKNSNDTIGNRTRDLPACSAVPQPTALPRAPLSVVSMAAKLRLSFREEYIYGVPNGVLRTRLCWSMEKLMKTA